MKTSYAANQMVPKDAGKMGRGNLVKVRLLPSSVQGGDRNKANYTVCDNYEKIDAVSVPFHGSAEPLSV